MFIGATIWTIAIPVLFADLTPSLHENCPLLITPDECLRAVWDWRVTCIGLAEVACAAAFIIIDTAYDEATSNASPLGAYYPFLILTYSHYFLVISSLLCMPLTYPLELFSVTGPIHWVGVSCVIAFFAIIAYIFGVTFWIIALVKIFYRWGWVSRNGIPAGAQRPERPEGDFVLQEV